MEIEFDNLKKIANHRSAYDAGYWWVGLTHCVCRLDKSLINKQRRKVTHENRHLLTLLPQYTS